MEIAIVEIKSKSLIEEKPKKTCAKENQ